MSLLAGKTGLILNIANMRSIASDIAVNCVKQGATCGYGYLPIPNQERRVKKALEEMGQDNGIPSQADAWLQPCDVGSDESIGAFFAAAKQRFGKIDFLVHSLAFANREYLQLGRFASTPRDVFRQALDVSAYSLIALTRAAAPLMPRGGTVIALSYLGAERAVPGYNVMGVAKAALESSARYLALELGEKNIRVNSLSAGPVRTLSAMAVGGIDEVFEHVQRKSPLRRNIDGDDVARTAMYLLSDLSSGITGETIHVDAGYSMVGL
jgi:enoyl-[acyl-carrier protein] reductase I